MDGWTDGRSEGIDALVTANNTTGNIQKKKNYLVPLCVDVM
jgi:hypothetical protein